MIIIGETFIVEGLMKSDLIREQVIGALRKGKFSPIGAFGVFEPQNMRLFLLMSSGRVPTKRVVISLLD